jgi:hypothetical protein
VSAAGLLASLLAFPPVQQQCEVRALHQQLVRKMLRRFGTSTVRKSPPVTEVETQQMVERFMKLEEEAKSDLDPTPFLPASIITDKDGEESDSEGEEMEAASNVLDEEMKQSTDDAALTDALSARPSSTRVAATVAKAVVTEKNCPQRFHGGTHGCSISQAQVSSHGWTTFPGS